MRRGGEELEGRSCDAAQAPCPLLPCLIAASCTPQLALVTSSHRSDPALLTLSLGDDDVQQAELEAHTRNQLLARVVLQWRGAAEEKRRREERVRGEGGGKE